MQTHKTIISNNSIEVNGFRKIFLDLIEEEEKQEQLDFDNKRRFSKIFYLAPKIHHNYIEHIIKTQFNDSVEDYIKTIPLFFEKFTRKDKNICDDNAKGETRLQTRRMNKKKKELLLYSAQLLKLIGGKDKFYRSSILCKSLVSFYKDEMKKTEEYTASHRLVRANGRILKLTKHEDKQRQKIAQIIRISKCLSDLAINRGFTYSLITLTLPPIFHPFPTKSDKCSYLGATPKEAHHKLMEFWKLIRANLAKAGLITGEHFFGLQTVESQQDSTLHLHCLVYHSKDNTETIHNIVNGVAERNNKEAKGDISKMVKNKNKEDKFDIRLNDGRASGATYVFKYITKTNAIYTDQDDNAIKNTACRSMYGVKGFSFFGVQNSITQFNFLHSNYLSHKKYYSKEIRQMIEDRDYYLFMTKYHKYFKNEYYYNEQGKKKLLGVTFDMSANKDFKELMRDKYLNKFKRQILIEKRQYSIFEIQEDSQIDNIEQLDLTEVFNLGASIAFEIVTSKQAFYDIQKEKFIEDCENLNVITLDTEEEIFNTASQKSKATTGKEEKPQHKVDTVTLTQPYSSKSHPKEQKAVLEDYQPPKMGDEFKEKLKLLKLN